jgi:hypothetical protein
VKHLKRLEKGIEDSSSRAITEINRLFDIPRLELLNSKQQSSSALDDKTLKE